MPCTFQTDKRLQYDDAARNAGAVRGARRGPVARDASADSPWLMPDGAKGALRDPAAMLPPDVDALRRLPLGGVLGAGGAQDLN